MLQGNQVRCNRSEVRLEMVAVSRLIRTRVVKTTRKKKGQVNRFPSRVPNRKRAACRAKPHC